MSRRPLSNIEHLAETNIACSVRLAGTLNVGELRTALACVQRRHPALRVLIRPEDDVLYYEPDIAPEIPVRTVPFADDGVYRAQWELELSTAFDHELPQLRVVYLQHKSECDLLFVTSHRICDGLSIFIIVKDALRALAGHTGLNAYEAVGSADIVGEHQLARPWLTKVGLTLINLCLSLLPGSGPAPKRKDYFVEWSAGREASASLRRQCKAQGASVHAAFLVMLDRALRTVLGARAPKWITCPIDLRRGRVPALKQDMVFYGGGNFKVRTGRWIEGDFWDCARVLTGEIRAQVEREVLEMPGRIFVAEKLRPLTCGQVRWLLRASEALQSKRRLRGIGLSNLGNVMFSVTDSPLPIEDIRFSFRSLNFGILGLVPYTVNEDMRFYCTCSQTFLNKCELDALKREFMGTLERQIAQKQAEAVTA
jgi:hypothetical protein